MAAVTPPLTTYKLCLHKAIIERGLLSSLQLETVMYACMRHEHYVQGVRCGFLLGDGTSVSSTTASTSRLL